MKSKCKIVVAHPFQQHSFKTATAIKEMGLLYKYVTTVYLKENNNTGKILSFLSDDNKIRAMGRRCDKLADGEVVQFGEILSLILLMVQRINSKSIIYTFFYWLVIRYFNIKLYRYITKEKIDIVIVYDVLSAYLIKLLKKNNIHCKVIVDMSAPYYNYMIERYQEDATLNPSMSDDLKKMLKGGISKGRCRSGKYEIENADAFLVASKVTKQSLIWGGVSEKNIYICHYGIDDFLEEESVIDNTEFIEMSDKPLKIIYVGSISEQKGAYQLMRIGRKLSNRDFQFDFYGSYDSKSSVFKEYQNDYNFHGHIPRSKMRAVYKKADLLVFPTLCDGFGFVTIEALLCGVPVIVSKNAGSAELIKDHINGFVYDPLSDDELITLLLHISHNRDILRKMQCNVKDSVIKQTWSKYNREIENAIRKIINEGKI